MGVEKILVDFIGQYLDRLGIISSDHFRPTLQLAWPRIITGLAIMSKQTVDLALVGMVVGTAGTAGLAFALGYWSIVVLLGLGLASGTVSLVSQNYGGGHEDRASNVVTQSVGLAIIFSLPVMIIFYFYTYELISILGAESDALRYGTIYLLYITPAVLFELLNLIASRTYTGVGDTYTEMIIRSSGAVLNITISAILIFVFGMGVAGAAIGTTFSTGVVMIIIGWGMVGRSYGVLRMKPIPIPMSLDKPLLDISVFCQLLQISVPEIGRRLAQGIIIFPLLWIAASFGPVIVTALEVARRIRAMIDSINWGMSLASSSLVGNHLGANDESEANALGAEIIRLTILIYLLVAGLVILFSSSIAEVFVSTPDEVDATVTFVAVAAISAIGLGLDGTASGVLVGAGDTRWPFVASLVGRYLFALPVALAGLITPLGVVGLYIALILESFIPGGINYTLFKSGRWQRVSRQYRNNMESKT